MTAFETTAEQYRRRVFTFARSLLSNREEAEEVTQDVLVRYWHHQERVEEEHLGSWLLRVTRNLCYDLLRRRLNAALEEIGEPYRMVVVLKRRPAMMVR